MGLFGLACAAALPVGKCRIGVVDRRRRQVAFEQDDPVPRATKEQRCSQTGKSGTDDGYFCD